MTPFGASTQAPAAPPGPGVAPPFAAPPTDRDPRTVWIRLGISGLLLALCCGGGTVGLGVVLAGTSRQMQVSAQEVVEKYLAALEAREFGSAYGLLCEGITDETSLESFTTTEQARPIVDYAVADVRAQQQLVVTASVTYAGQSPRTEEYVVVLEGQLRVCGEPE